MGSNKGSPEFTHASPRLPSAQRPGGGSPRRVRPSARRRRRIVWDLMLAGLHLAALFGFAVLMAAAALADFDRLIIPNRLPLGLALLWPAYFATGPAAASLAAVEAAAAALTVFVVGTLLFVRGLLGGGDVKLLSAAALWTGLDRLPGLLLLTGLFGGLLALFFLTPLGAQITAARRSSSGSAELARGTVPMPYGVAIAAAALVAALPARFS